MTRSEAIQYLVGKGYPQDVAAISVTKITAGLPKEAIERLGPRSFVQAAEAESRGLPSISKVGTGEELAARKKEEHEATVTQALSTYGATRAEYDEAKSRGIDVSDAALASGAWLAELDKQKYEESMEQTRKTAGGMLSTVLPSVDEATRNQLVDLAMGSVDMGHTLASGINEAMNLYQSMQTAQPGGLDSTSLALMRGEAQARGIDTSQESWMEQLGAAQWQEQNAAMKQSQQMEVASMSPYKWIPKWAMENPEAAAAGETAPAPGWLANITPGLLPGQQVTPGGPSPALLNLQDWQALTGEQKEQLGGYMHWISGSPTSVQDYAQAMRRRAAPGAPSTGPWGTSSWL